MNKNKKLPISPVMLVLLVWLVVLGIYAFTYYIPSQPEMKLLNADVAQKRAEVQALEDYLKDPAPLKQDIAKLKKEIDEVKSSFVNDGNVNMVISSAIQRYEISLNSVTLSSPTTYKGMRALPINLQLHGSTEHILQFIESFEKNENGSFVVNNVSFSVNSYSTEATMVLYLCTPAV